MPIHQEHVTVDGVPTCSLTIENGRANILDFKHCEALTKALRALAEEDVVRVVIIRGAGKLFSAGVDISQHTPDFMPKLLPAFHEIFDALLGLRAITIAAVRRHCLGGAAELAFACDRVVAEECARIGFPEIKVGCYPPVALAILPFRAHHGAMVEMVCSGDEVAPSQLHAWGLVDRLAPEGGMDTALEAELALYGGKSPAVLGLAAAEMHGRARKAWGESIPALEKVYLEKLLPHPDATEGIKAFEEKRQAQWQGVRP
ncbi:MAG: enoyl-CoA hydratase/isomerase family protein [Myxococcota bacterium]|nr:enoyl-CoA hydratase/isomerase family protein [Myxococcota bacterium]|tara:strand:- start:1582 stop:2358 length:777 start_codon:yes stop_codon:yes gene_type:complete